MRTEWYTPEFKPVRNGSYEIQGVDETDVLMAVFFNGFWYWPNNVDSDLSDKLIGQDCYWRGLTIETSDICEAILNEPK